MEAAQITDKKFSVLRYFIEYTSWVQNGGMDCPKGVVYPDKKTGNSRFYSYPRRIEEDFKNQKSKISQTWAGRICEDLESLGILGHDMILAPRQDQKSRHYYLKYGLDPFLELMKILCEEKNLKYLSCFAGMAYIQYHINEDLICAILAKKGVEMRQMLHIWQWSPAESQKIFAILVNKNTGSNPSGSNINGPENNENRVYQDYIHGMITGLSRKKAIHYGRNIQSVCLRLPVLSSELSESEKMNIIKSVNETTFKEHTWLTKYYSGINEHYNRHQREKWIIPILALISASPFALKEFLSGNWEPYGSKEGSFCYSEDGSSCMDFPIFTFLFTAINDISRTRNIPNERRIPVVHFRPNLRMPSSRSSGSPLFMIETDLGVNVCFDASFNTERIYFGSENGDIWENDNEQNYQVKIWLDLRAGWQSITQHDIPDMDRFVTVLQDRRSKVSQHLVSKMSNRLQHIIAYQTEPIDEESKIPGILVDELNRILSQKNFYDVRAFSLIEHSEAAKILLKKGNLYHDCSGFEYPSWTIVSNNRIFLEDAFPGLILHSDNSERERTWLQLSVSQQ